MTRVMGNKGEWSEFYVLLRTLADGHLTTGTGGVYPVSAVYDESVNSVSEYRIRNNWVDVYGPKGELVSVVNRAHVATLAMEVLSAVIAGSGVFGVEVTSSFMHAHGISSLHTQGAGKTDIRLEVYDAPTRSTLKLGFSIKSLLGSNPTLFNAGGDTTNFVYEAVGLCGDMAVVRKINSISGPRKYRDRVAAIQDMAGRLAYRDVANGILALNLQVIDSMLPEILADMILMYYSGHGGKISGLVAGIDEVNPCGFNQSHGHPYYEYKVKSFLRAAALGMTPARLWSGQLETAGGYIVVDSSGSLTCVHAHDMNGFEDYLYKCTSLDGPSGSRHRYGEAYLCGGSLMLKLPLQVRFTG